MTRKEVMHNLVKEEAKNLKKNATQEELNYLDFNSLNPQSPSQCIYGKMVGDCFYDRATDLIKKCCARVYQPDIKNPMDVLSTAKVNGNPQELTREEFFSPIEVFIVQKKNKENG